MWMLELLAFALALLTFVGITESGGHWRRRTYAPPPCTPRACQVSSWSKWSHCTQQCGTSGIQSRWRKKTVVESCGGSCSNVLSETRSCNTDSCHNSGTPTIYGCSCRQGYRGTCCEIVDGQWSQWTYFQCTASCGKGKQNRKRTCTSPPPSGGGFYCSGNHFETLDCYNGPCPVDGQWSHWTYLPCAVSCGQGKRNRTRTCTNPPPSGDGKDCSGAGIETLGCYNAPCPVDGQWSQWTYFQCTASCGKGTQNRKRTCTNPPPSGGGDQCTGIFFDTLDCNNGPCPVNGQWSHWTYFPCAVSCGQGKRNRSRTCTNPPPSGGGKDCSGASFETLDCNNAPCPVDGHWSQWTYFQCTASCGKGKQNRKRTCTSPPPSGGGDYCSGNHFETLDCNNGDCLVDGQWSHWTYFPCSVSCGHSGQRNRTRSCTNPPPEGRGNDCSGAALETLDCNNGPCLGNISDAEFGFAISTTSIESDSVFALMKRVMRIIIDRHGVLKISFSVFVYGNIIATKFTFDNYDFSQEDIIIVVNETRLAMNETREEPGTSDLQTALQEAELLCNLTTGPNTTKAFIVLGIGTGSAYRLQTLFGGTLSPTELEIFRNVTLQILQEAEDQLRNASSSQPSNKHMERRAIQDFGYLNPQDVPQMIEDTQQRLLG